jgi:uncharacterized protein YybS (DUF2232 family)
MLKHIAKRETRGWFSIQHEASTLNYSWICISILIIEENIFIFNSIIEVFGEKKQSLDKATVMYDTKYEILVNS